MKKGYIRLLVFEFLICMILFLNSFVWNILSRHTMNVFLFVLIVLFGVFFGFEKDRHRYIKDILMDVFIFLVIFFILYYLFGIIISFARPGNYYNLKGVIDFIIPCALYVIFREYLRYHTMCKADGSRITTVVSVIVFIWLDISTAIFYRKFGSSYNIFLFFALTFLPSVVENISFSYITLKTGYKPIMLYALVMELYYYLMPIVPNPNEYVSSIIQFLLPIILCYRIYVFFKKDRDEQLHRDYKKRHFGWLFTTCLITAMLVYFTSGYFHYWSIAVASGSMHPVIKKGDVVVIEKIDDSGYGNVGVGDVLAFRYDNVIIVHRVVNIINDKGEYYFYTKGDANALADSFVVEDDMVIGVVNVKVPFVGIPTVWLNEL